MARPPLLLRVLPWLCLGALTACFLRPPYAVVQVTDPDGIAADASTLVIQAQGGDEKAFELAPGALSDGELYTPVSNESGVRRLSFEARRGDGLVLGRAVVDIEFQNVDQAQVQVPLLVPCDPRGPRDGQCTTVPGCGVGQCTELGTCACGACGDAILDVGERCDDGNDDNPNDGCHGCQLLEWTPGVTVGLAEGPLDLSFDVVDAITVDQDGNVFFAASDLDLEEAAWRLDATTGRATRFAGGGELDPADVEDGAVATTLRLTLNDLEADGLGDLYAATGTAVLRIDRAGRVRTVAGGGSCVSTFGQMIIPLEGIGARSACFDNAASVAVGGNGDVYVADRDGHAVYRVDPTTGLLSLFAGTRTNQPPPPSAEGTVATLYPMPSPTRLALLPDDRLVVLTGGNAGTRALRVVEQGTARTLSPGLASQAELAIDLTVLDEDRLLVGTDDGVLVVDTATGQVHNIRVEEPGWPWLEFRATAVGVDPFGAILVFHGDARELWKFNGAGVVHVAGNGGRLPCCDDVPGTATRLGYPEDLAAGGAGELFITSLFENRIRKLDTALIISTYIGTGEPGPPRFDLPLAQQRIYAPRSVDIAPDGTVFFADADGGFAWPHIRRIQPGTEVVDIVGGVDMARPLLAAGESVGAVTDLIYDVGRNTVFYVDELNNLVRSLNLSSGVVRTVAGVLSAGEGLVPGQATSTVLQDPRDITLDEAGFLLVADPAIGRLLRVDPEHDAACTLIADLGQAPAFPCFEGGARSAPDFTPTAVAVDSEGSILVSTTTLIYRLGPDGQLVRYAGGGGVGRGDGGLAGEASFTDIRDLEIDEKGVSILDGNTVRRVEEGVITTVAGPVHLGDGRLSQGRLQNPLAMARLDDRRWVVADGASGRVRDLDFTQDRVRTLVGYPDGFAWGDDSRNLAYFRELLAGAAGVARDNTGALYVSESSAHVVLRVDAEPLGSPRAWTVEPFVGFPGDEGFADGSLSAARVRSPAGMAFDEGSGVLFIADAGNHVVRAVRTEGAGAAGTTVTTVLGTPGQRGTIADGVPSRSAYLNRPTALTVARSEAGMLHLFVADTENHRVLRVDDPLSADAISTLVVGDGAPNSSGEGTPARFFPVESPGGVAVDAFGNLYVTSSNTVRQILAGADGIAGGEDEVRTLYGRPPRTRFPEPVTQCLTDIDVEASTEEATRLLILDACQGFVLTLDRRYRP